MRKTIFALALAGGAVATAANLGCNGILDIETAQLDPTFGTDGGSGVDAGFPFAVTDISVDHYCTLIQAACTGQFQEYLTKDVCVQMAPQFDIGTPGEQANNTLSCRQYHANAALSAPQVHCHHAGPLGGEVCGPSPCTAFCLLDFGICQAVAYPTESACEATCNGTVDAGGTDAESPTGYQFVPDAGEVALTVGDSFNCRIYHLEAASNPATAMATTIHCPHTAQTSDVCHN